MGVSTSLDSNGNWRCVLELQTLHHLHAGKLAELPQQRLGHRRIERQQQHRFAARAAAAEVEGADVEPRFAKRSEEHTSELQSLMRTSYAVFCLKKKKHKNMRETKTYRH